MAIWTPMRGGSIERVGRNRWAGRRLFECPKASVKACEASLYGTTFPGYSGIYAPKCTRVGADIDWSEDYARVIAYYETRRVPGVARIRVDGARSQAEELREDLNGQPIEMLDPEDLRGETNLDGLVHYWRAPSGSNRRIKKVVAITIETAYDAGVLDAGVIFNRMNTVNSTTFTKIQNSPPESLLLDDVDARYVDDDDELWYVDYRFLYNAAGWNNDEYTQKGLFAAQPLWTFKVRDNKAVVNDSGFSTPKWMPKIVKNNPGGGEYDLVDSPKVPLRLYHTSDFNDLDSIILL